MADIKLYKIKEGKATKKTPINFKLERDIQKLCDENLEIFFGVRFLVSEYSTGNKHKGRIDSLGIDENNCPVIIEYKRDSKENIIPQGLFYLDWLMDHRANFEALCTKVSLTKVKDIDWSNPRLLCIAKDFTRYDSYAIGQIDRNIELIRYRFFGDSIIFELAAGTVQKQTNSNRSTGSKNGKQRSIADAIKTIKKDSPDLWKLYEVLEDYLNSLGDDVQKKELKHYHAFSRIKNFACIELKTQKKEIYIYLNINFEDITSPLPNIEMEDVSNKGHLGTGVTKIAIKSIDNLEAVKYLIERSYDNS